MGGVALSQGRLGAERVKGEPVVRKFSIYTVLAVALAFAAIPTIAFGQDAGTPGAPAAETPDVVVETPDVVAEAGTTITTTTETPSVFKEIFDNYIMPLLGTLATAFFGWLWLTLRTRFNVDLDEKYRAGIEAAAKNAGGLLLEKLGREGIDKLLSSREHLGTSDVGRTIIDYMKRGAGDALDHFGIKDNDAAIAEKVIAKASLVANEGRASAPVVASSR